jgi:CubicO group peptidase (beta-lactamase class C family)
MQGYVTEGGAYYAPANWRHEQPGTRYFYSNEGSALVGAVVEHVTGMFNRSLFLTKDLVAILTLAFGIQTKLHDSF